MDYKLPIKINYFATLEEQKEFRYEYVEYKSKYEEVIEMVHAIAMKSIGTEYADTMSAEETFDGTLWGLGGRDTLHGDGRDNLIYGGSERDGLEGENVYGSIDRFLDNDTMTGGGGSDTMYGQAGNDSMVSGEGDDFLYGGADNDILVGNGRGTNVFDGGWGIDAIILDEHDGMPDEVWDFMDEGDRLFLSSQFMEQTGGIDDLETTLWNADVQRPHRNARNFGDFYQSTEVKNSAGETLFFIEGPTFDGVTIGWNAGGMEVLDINGDWDGAKFQYEEDLTTRAEWFQTNF